MSYVGRGRVFSNAMYISGNIYGIGSEFRRHGQESHSSNYTRIDSLMHFLMTQDCLCWYNVLK